MGGFEITGGDDHQENKALHPTVEEVDPQEVDPFEESTELEKTPFQQRHPVAKILFVIVVGGIVAAAVYSAIASLF